MALKKQKKRQIRRAKRQANRKEKRSSRLQARADKVSRAAEDLRDRADSLSGGAAPSTVADAAVPDIDLGDTSVATDIADLADAAEEALANLGDGSDVEQKSREIAAGWLAKNANSFDQDPDIAAIVDAVEEGMADDLDTYELAGAFLNSLPLLAAARQSLVKGEAELHKRVSGLADTISVRTTFVDSAITTLTEAIGETEEALESQGVLPSGDLVQDLERGSLFVPRPGRNGEKFRIDLNSLVLGEGLSRARRTYVSKSLTEDIEEKTGFLDKIKINTEEVVRASHVNLSAARSSFFSNKTELAAYATADVAYTDAQTALSEGKHALSVAEDLLDADPTNTTLIAARNAAATEVTRREEALATAETRLVTARLSTFKSVTQLREALTALLDDKSSVGYTIRARVPLMIGDGGAGVDSLVIHGRRAPGTKAWTFTIDTVLAMATVGSDMMSNLSSFETLTQGVHTETSINRVFDAITALAYIDATEYVYGVAGPATLDITPHQYGASALDVEGMLTGGAILFAQSMGRWYTQIATLVPETIKSLVGIGDQKDFIFGMLNGKTKD